MAKQKYTVEGDITVTFTVTTDAENAFAAIENVYDIVRGLRLSPLRNRNIRVKIGRAEAAEDIQRTIDRKRRNSDE